MRGRYKKRGLHGNGMKQDGSTPSLDLCPCCYSFYCDPDTMSRAFSDKIRGRVRKGLCPSCGNPISHCKCKSSSKVPAGSSLIRTHNNKKRRQELSRIKAGEAALKAWEKTEERRLDVMSQKEDADIWYALYNHKMPPVTWKDILALAQRAGLGEKFLAVMYPVWH